MQFNLQDLTDWILSGTSEQTLSSAVLVDPKIDSSPFNATQSETYLDFCSVEGFENDLDLNIIFNGQQFPLPFLLYTSCSF